MLNEDKAIKKLEDICSDKNIPLKFYFWDETLYGAKPNEFSTYYVENESSEASSNDEAEVESISIRFDYFDKSNEFRKTKLDLIKSLRADGFFVQVLHESLEITTRYNHISLLIEYSEVNENE